MDRVNNGIHQPVTVFLPSDGVMMSLPQEQKDFLFHQDNQAQLVEYLKYHILQAQKVGRIQTLMNSKGSQILPENALWFSVTITKTHITYCLFTEVFSL